MKLNRLAVQNFKGLKSFEIKPNGGSVRIYGDNKTYKTTVADAIKWLLTDKDTLERSTDQMGIKTMDAGQVIHAVEHWVEGEFDIVTLKKVYKEKWTKPGGKYDKELTGHTTDYFVDGVPVRQKDYLEKVYSIIDEELLRILTIPNYFPEVLHWEKRRSILLGLVDDVSVEEIIKSHPTLARYPEILNGKDGESVRKVLKARKKKLNEEIDDIPIRVDEANRSIVETGDADEAAYEALRRRRKELETKKYEIEAGGNIATLKVKLQELNAEIAGLRNVHRKQVDATVGKTRDAVDEVRSQYREIDVELQAKKSEYEDVKRELQRASQYVIDGEGTASEARAKEPLSKDEPEECPYCNQPMLKQNYDEYIEHFNHEKAEKLKKINEELSAAVNKRDEIEKRLETVKTEGQNVAEKYKQAKDLLETKESELARVQDSSPDFEETAKYKELAVELEGVNKQIANHVEEKKKAIEKLQEAVSDTDAEIKKHEQAVLQKEQNEKAEERIKELRGELRKYGKEFEQVKKDLFVIEEFIRVRSKYVTERINSKFKKVKWELFRDQINEGVKEVCEAWYEDVPYSRGLNHSSRIKAGLEIIDVLSKHFGKSVPIIVDNCEAVTVLPKYDAQVIALYVSKKDKELRVEYEKPAKADKQAEELFK